MEKFSHLHVHSEYSTLDGMSSVKALVSRVKELGQPALAITDHGSTSALWQLQNTAKKEGIKPILGTEFYYERENDSANGHLIVFAKNNKGLENIFKLQDYSYTEGFYRRPRINFEKLVEYKDGLIVTSACMASTLGQLLLENKYEESIEWVKKFKDIFGDDFYLEIQPNLIPEQWEINKQIIKIARELNIKFIATNDVHYTLQEDSFAHEVVLAMQTNKKMSDEKRFRFNTQDFWLKSNQEMIDTFVGIDKEDILEAMNTTQEIVDKCNAEIIVNNYLPKYHDIPEGYTSRKLLAENLMKGARDKNKIKNKKYMSEVQNELDVIDSEGYSDYFLIVQDYVRSARQRDEVVGDGRGSASGSKVSYLLDITRIDPSEYNLLFERFLAKGRVPDIDQDFSNQDAVFKDLQQKYGEKSVARIVAFGRMKPKAVSRKVFSTFGHDMKTINSISKMIPDTVDTIKEALEIEPRLQSLKDKYDVEFSVIEKLEGMISHESKHAGGVIIYPNLHSLLPIKTVGEDRTARIVAFDMEMIAEIGFHKFDILGLETISIIKETKDSIKRTTGKDIDLYSIDYNDKEVYNMLSKGDVSGVFQLANQSQKVMEQKPTCFLDLIAINALIRPGVGDWNEYLDRRSGKEYIIHSLRENYMRETQGTMTYQEQFLLDCYYFAGWDIAYADAKVRKNRDIRNDIALREKFYEDATARGHDIELIKSIWKEIEDAVADGYSFNKSHSASYAMLSFQTAWLKYYYPEHFYAALMSAEKTDNEGQAKISNYISECKQKCISILPPDINDSTEKFVVTDNGIAYRITAIKHIGDSAINHINKLRPISSFEDFLERKENRYAKSNVIINLIKAGCFDCFESNRGNLLNQYELYRDSKEPKTYEYNEKIKSEWEREVLGLYLSSHPMDRYGFRPLDYYDDNSDAMQGGEVISIAEVFDKNNNAMAFVNIDTLYGIIKVIIFSSMWNEEVQTSFKEGNIVMIKGRRSGNSILLNSVEVLE